MNPELWGPHAWYLIYSIAFTYPSNPTAMDIHNTRNFFECLGKVLPCEACKVNYKKHLIKIPLCDKVLGSRNNLVSWVLSVHNEVNKENGKSKASINDIVKFIVGETKESHTKTNSIGIYTVMTVFIVSSVLFAIFIILRNKNSIR